LQVVSLDFVAGARAARGVVVVIDVFRAFSTACYAIDAGAAAIHPVSAEDRARELKARNPDWWLMGERHGRPLPGFELGNSPTDVLAAPIAGRTLLHTTHAGTQGLVAATHAEEVLTGSLVNAAAIVRYLQRRRPAQVSLVRMGHEARERCAEDDLCAALVEARLRGWTPPVASAQQVRELLRDAPAAQKFFDPACDWAPAMDFEFCTALDRYDFVLRLTQRDSGLPRLERVEA